MTGYDARDAQGIVRDDISVWHRVATRDPWERISGGFSTSTDADKHINNTLRMSGQFEIRIERRRTEDRLPSGYRVVRRWTNGVGNTWWWANTLRTGGPYLLATAAVTGAREHGHRVGTQVAVGDRVLDPMDDRWREVVRIDTDEGTAYMADGGCMSVAECATSEKRLPSEDLFREGS